MRKLFLFFLGLFILGSDFFSFCLPPDQITRYSAKEVEPKGLTEEQAYFFRPTAFVFKERELFVLESSDAKVKVFSEFGVFKHSFGRKGTGPAEFDTPTGLDILGDNLYITDAGNRRIQILNKKGKYLSGFNVSFFPKKIQAIEEEIIVVSHLPSGFKGKEKMIHCFNSEGELLWEALDSFFSGDSVYDSFRNYVFLKKDGNGNFYIIGRSEDRFILRMNKNGDIVKKIKIEPEYPSKKIMLPGHKKSKELSAFCWDCDWQRNKFYLLIPEYTEDRDIGPGKELAVVNESGQIEAFIDFPFHLNRIAMAGEIIYALDMEDKLRLFKIEKK